MNTDIIRRAFEKKVDAYAKSKGYPVFYENVKYQPQAGQIYLRSFLIPARTRSLTLGGDHRLDMGVYQVSIIIPQDIGTGPAMQIAREIEALFPIYSILDEEGLRVQVMSHLNVLQGVSQEATFMLPVSLQYRCDTN